MHTNVCVYRQKWRISMLQANWIQCDCFFLSVMQMWLKCMQRNRSKLGMQSRRGEIQIWTRCLFICCFIWILTEFQTKGMKPYSHLLPSVSGNNTLHCRNAEGARGQLPGETRYGLKSPEVISCLVAYLPKGDLNSSELNSNENNKEWIRRKEKGRRERWKQKRIKRDEVGQCWEVKDGATVVWVRDVWLKGSKIEWWVRVQWVKERFYTVWSNIHILLSLWQLIFPVSRFLHDVSEAGWEI